MTHPDNPTPCTHPGPGPCEHGYTNRLGALRCPARPRAALPPVTPPWAGYGCRVEVDDDGEITLTSEPWSRLPSTLDADEATEVAAALLTAVGVSRDITGERTTT